MAGTATEGGRVAAEEAVVRGAAADAPTMGARTVALVSMIKFLRLLKMQPAKVGKRRRQ